jgi:putative addiction module component (TIGR02574 family)
VRRFEIGSMPKPEFDYRTLSIAERLQLVEDIWDSIAQEADALPLTPEQKAELDRRWAEHQRDPGSAIPWGKVRDELYRHGA